MRHVLLILAFALTLPACAQNDRSETSTAQTGTVEGDLGAALDDYLSNRIEGGFSGAALVARDGEIVLRKGYGYADRAAGLVNTPETVFQIGSVTKPLTATAILHLRDADRLDVTDPITDYFDDVPADKRGITLHHLLSHTAGFPGGLGDDYDAIGREDYIQEAMATPLNRAPGTGYEYSNVGFALLGAIIEGVTGDSYDAYLQTMLREAGIERTGYRLADDLPYAHGYRGEDDLGLPFERAWAEDGPYWNLRANGGLLSTVDDLYRFHLALERGEILSDESRALAYTEHTDEGPNSGSSYGYGWAIFPTPRGTRLIAHNGGDPGFAADFLRYLDDDTVIILVSNDAQAPADRLAFPLAQLAFGGTPEPFRLPSAEPVALDRLRATVPGQRALAFVETINAGTEEAYRAFMAEHLDAPFQRNPDRLLGFFGAVADEIGHAPVTLTRATWNDDGPMINLYADLADGRGYWIELGFQPGGEQRIAGMQTDYTN